MINFFFKNRKRLGAATVLLASALFFVCPARADTVDDLQKSIDAKNQEIRQLEAEAKKYRDEIANKQVAAKTLSGELARIDAALGVLKRAIAIAQKQIQGKELEIRAAAVDIGKKEAEVAALRAGLGSVLDGIYKDDRQSVFAVLFSHPALSDFFQEFDRAASIQDMILQALPKIRELRNELQKSKDDAQAKKQHLENLKISLGGSKKLQESQRNDRAVLLAETKNQEKQYAALLADREVRRAALENEVRSIEEKIKITVDTSILPSRGSGVLGWPLPNLFLSSCRLSLKIDAITNCITQYFGFTSFAAIGAYSGKGHNGTDFRADVGTPVLAAEAGVVAGVGDTDAGCRGASYGKWILLRHPNNLSTLYGHLSVIDVSAGQAVQRGSRIAYSGRTGYATGPHLHFSVFATQAVQIQDIRSKVCGRIMTLPVGALNGYLNPLDYL